MKKSSGRKIRRAVLKPWKARKLDVEVARRRAAFDIELRSKVVAALKAREAKEAAKQAKKAKRKSA